METKEEITQNLKSLYKQRGSLPTAINDNTKIVKELEAHRPKHKHQHEY